jgi:hypothetical protein
MNYIKHLTGFFDKVIQDDRLNPTHISLYVALFQFWNVQRFKNPISISRDEVMRVSKICSKATYHKCMKDLHQFDYVLYDPSYNPFRGSLVTIIDMELKSEQIRKTKRQRINKQTSSKQELNKQATSSEQALVPSINNINTINNTNKENKNKSIVKNKIFEAPTFIEVETYFLESKVTIIEAQKFFNYYESNGWKIGGRSPMKNWKAAANNWMLNAEKFNPKVQTSNLHLNQEKDYDIPL